MFEIIRKGLLMGLGAAVVSKEKIDEATRRLVEQGKISKEDAEKLAQDLWESGEKQWEELQVHIREAVGKVLENLDIPRRTDLQEMKDRLADLEQRVSGVETTLRNGSSKE